MSKSEKLSPVVILPDTKRRTQKGDIKIQSCILSYARDVKATGKPMELDRFREMIAPKLSRSIKQVKTEIAYLANNFKLCGKQLNWADFGIIAKRGPDAQQDKRATILLDLLKQQKKSKTTITLPELRRQFENKTNTKPSSWQGVYNALAKLLGSRPVWSDYNVTSHKGRTSNQPDFSATMAEMFPDMFK